MAMLHIGRCGLTTDKINAGLPFWFDGVCVGRLATTDDLNDDTMHLVIGSEVDNDTLGFIHHCAKRLSESGDRKLVRITRYRATFTDEQ